jgi:hypothetical protein
VETGIQRILTILKYWIPACAGMTDNGLFRLFTKPPRLGHAKFPFPSPPA